MPKDRPGTIDALVNSPIKNFLATMSPGITGNIAQAFQPAVKVARKAQLKGDMTSTQPEAPVKPSASQPVAPKPAAPKREKATVVNAGLTPMGISGKPSNFKTKGAISTAAGGTTDYSLNYKPTKISYKGTGSQADSTGLTGSGTGIKATKMAEAPQQSAPKSRKEMRQERRVARLEKRQDIQRKKGEQALSEGRTMDAKQKRYRYNRLQERIDRNKNK